MTVIEKIEKLRFLMKEHGFKMYLINSSDPHSSEYTAPHFKTREYMSGFTGSAGTLLITMDKAYLWTDGRYFIQAAQQLDGSGITLMKQGEKDVPSILEFLAKNIDEMKNEDGSVALGFDPKTVSRSFYEKLCEKDPGFCTIDVPPDTDLVDKIWTDRPPVRFTPVFELETEYTGKTRADKLRELSEKLELGENDIFVISALDEIAWLLNIRGSDVKYTPVALSYLIIRKDRAKLFICDYALDEKLRQELSADGIDIKPYESFYEELERAGNESNGGKLFFDKDTLSYGAYCCYGKGSADTSAYKAIRSPIVLMKALKNDTECENIRKAHIIDGVAVTKLIYALKTGYKGRHSELTELHVAYMLDELRRKGDCYLYQSFEPISAYGEHAAIVHYSADEESNARLDDKGFLLLDTGGQYKYGTTDITRTIALGELSEEEKKAYTAVLKGNLRLAAVKFKKGCSGVNLDVLARQPLWEMGLDFNHGTGHGVGYCLGVHEGPQGIRMRDQSPVPFEAGMLTSDEPGVYIEGKFGIRLENLMLCVPCDDDLLCFETVTVVPFDRDAVIADDLTQEDKKLLNDYHLAVYEKLSPYLTEEENEWLRKETAPF